MIKHLYYSFKLGMELGAATAGFATSIVIFNAGYDICKSLLTKNLSNTKEKSNEKKVKNMCDDCPNNNDVIFE